MRPEDNEAGAEAKEGDRSGSHIVDNLACVCYGLAKRIIRLYRRFALCVGLDGLNGRCS